MWYAQREIRRPVWLPRLRDVVDLRSQVTENDGKNCVCVCVSEVEGVGRDRSY